jgi:hypothetical protein
MPKPLDFNKEVIFASDCEPCECCGEPVCPVCLDHYAECDCPGPDSEEDEDEDGEGDDSSDDVAYLRGMNAED